MSHGRSLALSSNITFGGDTFHGGSSTTVRVPASPRTTVFSFRDAHRPSRVTDVLSAALDTGLACAVVLIFFILQYPKSGMIGLNTVQKWWGNTVFVNTADGKNLPYKPLPASGMFG